MHTRKKAFKFILKTLLVILVPFLLFLIYFVFAILIKEPVINDRSAEKTVRLNPSENYYTLGNNWLKKSESGLWEMYIEGDGFERGVAIGKLTKELAEKQETAFIKQIKELIPSENYLNYLKYFVAYFNRKLPDYITDEYKEEIYGVSLYASDKFDYIGPKYYRILNYHGAHDIGHALQDKNMTVGCTSFAAWNQHSEDGKMIVGRNFDFYSGDEFAENKIVCFCKPKTGHKFMYITWAGFTGVVSGMNDQGVTVTINAAKSDIPTSAATPVSLVAKEILQYSKNIQEAFEIAQKRDVFVSESIFIASTNDNKSYIIEKTPTKTNLYSENRELLVCSNHYQSALFKSDYSNNKNIMESSSIYRKVRMEQLLEQTPKMNYLRAAQVMRDQTGINDKNIGLTNEKGINQLIAHHSVIIKPEDRLMWVSTQPFQLGKYYCYDLNKVFANASTLKENKEIIESDKTIEEDPFLNSKQYISYTFFNKVKNYIQNCTKSDFNLIVSQATIENFIGSNSESYYTYWIVGDYYKKTGDLDKAILNYNLALTKEVATDKEANKIKELVTDCTNKLKQ
ncbi:MAG: C45 family peptidase [Bacteroidota bacterium]|nr:C45 family peptidase [Bacteroidota bacterium]